MNSRQVCIVGGFTVKFNWSFLKIFSFGFLLLFATAAAAQGKAEKDKIRIGYAARAVTHSLPFLAQEAGFFRDEGLQVEVVRTSGAVSPMALLSGDTDFATMSAFLMIPVAARTPDVVMLGGYQEIEVDFTANNPGRTLFHCHQQLHMDFGFMALFDYA